MAGHEWEDWFEREEFIGQISDIRVQNLQVERELVQKRTFTRWMNLHLEKCDPPIEVQDLFLDIRDGHILMALLEELSGCQMLHRYKRSSHRIFRLNNIAKVLSFLEERNVKLVSIDAADVADGNSSIILGLIWNIILFFQIKELTGNIRSQFPSSSSLSSIPTSSDSDASCCSTPSGERQSASTAMREHSKAIKKLLQWVQKRTRKYSVAVKDFGKSWTSGLAFLAVIKSIDPSLVDMRKALLRNAKDNLEDSFRIAHYSLGIPRLLEPEDVTINAPDEQSIMTYVSQFLEHFPGREEPEEPVPPIERSVSMGRLNLREKDSNHIGNSIQQSRVKERSHMFQRVCTQSPPRILISSVSEDRSAMSPPFRPAAARSWSSEDILADSPHMEEISSSVAEKPQESASDVSTNSTSKSPELSYAHSPTGSSLPESVTSESMIGDSAISSPDSWVESELGGMQERLCESDSSLCDSGTAWDVYRATPVEVTNLDEGCVLSMEERAPKEESIPESYVDEGICSLGSLENPVQKSQGDFEKKQPEVVEEKEEVHLEKYNLDMPVEKVPDHSKAEIAEEEPSEQTIQDTSQSREPEPSVGLCNAVELTSSAVEKLHENDHSNQSQPKKNNVGDRAVDLIEGARDHEGQIAGQSVGLNESGNSEELQGETECQERQENTMIEDVGETREEASEEVLREDLNAQENFSSETLANTDPTSQDRAPETSLDPSAGRNVPLISISSEPEEQNLEGICDSERQHPARQDEVQPEGTDPDVDCPPNPHENNLDFNYNVDIPLCPVTESDQPKASEQTRDRESQHLDEHGTSQNIGESDTGDKMTMSECELTCQTSSSEATPVNAEQEMDSTDQPDGHKDTAATEQNTPDSVNSKPSGTFEPGCLHRDTDLFYTDFDQSPGPEDVVGAPVEPMDLFYPDKEESMFLEPPDAETQSWPSVLSVSALKPAPASETQADQPLSLLGEDFSHGADWTQENDELIPKTNQDTDAASKPQELCVLPGETTGGLWGDDAPADGSDLRTSGRARENTEPVSEGSIRQDESQIPPVLRHRKGARSTESTGDRPAVTAASSGDDNGDSDSGCSDSWELYVLLLLWLLLYCFWLLPQMDLKTLPSLLLNLEP